MTSIFLYSIFYTSIFLYIFIHFIHFIHFYTCVYIPMCCKCFYVLYSFYCNFWRLYICSATSKNVFITIITLLIHNAFYRNHSSSLLLPWRKIDIFPTVLKITPHLLHRINSKRCVGHGEIWGVECSSSTRRGITRDVQITRIVTHDTYAAVL